MQCVATTTQFFIRDFYFKIYLKWLQANVYDAFNKIKRFCRCQNTQHYFEEQFDSEKKS
jgi:hypothetical protein